MRHVCLTCNHHPNPRWSCKSIAFTPGKGYNGARHIFYLGENGNILATPECKCPPTDLILAPGETWHEDV